ncbi:hypothetical protein EVAR_28342_1 [Eumeta japonica]|uniref:Cuticle protein 16.5 n=1 Tax=Eumeta variegata TaxID=151549 RepID=A0A4C1V8N7_EUMVA|nr:hypothetical protein EVAR_28342_1 [Eumeta japonica]
MTSQHCVNRSSHSPNLFSSERHRHDENLLTLRHASLFSITLFSVPSSCSHLHQTPYSNALVTPLRLKVSPIHNNAVFIFNLCSEAKVIVESITIRCSSHFLCPQYIIAALVAVVAAKPSSIHSVAYTAPVAAAYAAPVAAAYTAPLAAAYTAPVAAAYTAPVAAAYTAPFAPAYAAQVAAAYSAPVAAAYAAPFAAAYRAPLAAAYTAPVAAAPVVAAAYKAPVALLK